ncbi:MAG: ATP-binding protein [Deltaproteobacteria bacterium]|nr:ATP-binding protein [Deltaproteobacteria bacterium]
MKLIGMANAWREQQKNPEFTSMAFDERFAMLAEAEKIYRLNQRIKRSLRAAKLKQSHACIEDIEYAAKRELDKAVMRQLATCRWVTEHQTVIVTGATGTGKTFIACALAQQAMRQGFRALYRRANRFFAELLAAHADGSYPRLLQKYSKLDVLIIDDFAKGTITEQQRKDLDEVLDDRYGERSTIIASQVPTRQWHDYLADPTTADAICERLLHRAHKITLKGPSRRKEELAE